MRILKRRFIFPIMIHKTSTVYGDSPDITLRFRKSGMNGSMKSTSFTFELTTKNNKYQWAFVWRPDVTRYWWMDSKPCINATGESDGN